uniref:Uncharacterized protein n=1 Tax=Cacopsylla melanoneura TaxID=428564 RepID=A0A8D8ZY88_9HEMI
MPLSLVSKKTLPKSLLEFFLKQTHQKKKHKLSSVQLIFQVVGWGLNPKTHNLVPNVLRPAIVQLIPWELCVQDRDMFYITSASTLCAISVDGKHSTECSKTPGMDISYVVLTQFNLFFGVIEISTECLKGGETDTNFRFLNGSTSNSTHNRLLTKYFEQTDL